MGEGEAKAGWADGRQGTGEDRRYNSDPQTPLVEAGVDASEVYTWPVSLKLWDRSGFIVANRTVGRTGYQMNPCEAHHEPRPPMRHATPPRPQDTGPVNPHRTCGSGTHGTAMAAMGPVDLVQQTRPR